MAAQPVGCTLNQVELSRVTARYAAFADHYRATVHFEKECARIDLRGEKKTLKQGLDEMIETENVCCAKLLFHVSESADGYHVELRASGVSGGELEILCQVVPMLFPGAKLESPDQDG